MKYKYSECRLTNGNQTMQLSQNTIYLDGFLDELLGKECDIIIVIIAHIIIIIMIASDRAVSIFIRYFRYALLLYYLLVVNN